MDLKDITQQLAGLFQGKDSGLDRRYELDFGDSGKVFINARVNPNRVDNAAEDDEDPDATLTLSVADYAQLLGGGLTGSDAIRKGRLKVSGDIEAVAALGTYLANQR